MCVSLSCVFTCVPLHFVWRWIFSDIFEGFVLRRCFYTSGRTLGPLSLQYPEVVDKDDSMCGLDHLVDQVPPTLTRASLPHVAVSTLPCAARLVEQGHVAPDTLQFIVFDEADHMLRPHQLPYMQTLLEAVQRARGRYWGHIGLS